MDQESKREIFLLASGTMILMPLVASIAFAVFSIHWRAVDPAIRLLHYLRPENDASRPSVSTANTHRNFLGCSPNCLPLVPVGLVSPPGITPAHQIRR